MIDKINKFDHGINDEIGEDLNQKVEDLFISTEKSRNNMARRTEIPIGELSMHKDLLHNSRLDIDPDYSPFDAPATGCEGPFKITKVPRNNKHGKKFQNICTSSAAKGLNFDIIENMSDYQKFKDPKSESKDIIERYSDITNDKSSTSFINESDEDAASPFQVQSPELSK